MIYMRCGAADAYLHPVPQRSNLELLTGALVTRLLLDGTSVRGLEADVAGEAREVRAEREVTLSAGAYNTPQILMLSGIGIPGDLAPFAITPVVDLPVGENLQDHILVQLAYLTDTESLIAADTPENQALLEKEAIGMLSSNARRWAVCCVPATAWTRSTSRSMARLCCSPSMASVCPTSTATPWADAAHAYQPRRLAAHRHAGHGAAIVRGNTNAPTIMIAEQAADMIRS